MEKSNIELCDMYDYRNGRRVEWGKYFCKLLTLYVKKFDISECKF